MNRFVVFLAFAGVASAQSLSPTAFRALGKACIPQSDRNIVTSIVRVESGFHPYALSVNYPESVAHKYGFASGRIYLKDQPRSANEAVAWAKDLAQSGLSVSVGLLQVNAQYWSGPISELLDPCQNLKTGWQVFSEKYYAALKTTNDPGRALRMALSAYNTGSTTLGMANGYVSRVLLAH